MKIAVHEAKGSWSRAGFTLLEMLIAVVILGILAMVIVPQLTSSTDDAKVSAVKANLSAMRSAIDNYAAQHGGAYPGAVKKDGTGTAITDNAECATAFVEQLTYYSDATGKTAATKPTGVSYGPYIKGAGIPINPFNNESKVTCDATETDLTKREPSSGNGWKFYSKTGVLIASDGGTGHAAY